MLRIFHNTSFNFIGYWRWAAAVTSAFLLAGLASFLVRGPIEYGIEFTGGTLMQVEFAQPTNAGVIRAAVRAAGVDAAEIQSFGSQREFTIRAQERAEAAAGGQAAGGAASTARRVEQGLVAQFGAENVTIVRTEAVGPRVGEELRRNAVIAILLSFAVTLIYLAIRFEWRFGVAAVLATGHDLITTLAFLKLMNIEVTLTVVAAILTVIGYSLNDTIIIFDRVRENLRKKRKETLHQTLNRSINETLPRAILTHGTTAAATLALLVFAGPVIRPFAWVMLFGIITGTFSSMYVASPLLLAIERRWPRQIGDQGTLGARVPREAARGAKGSPAAAKTVHTSR